MKQCEKKFDCVAGQSLLSETPFELWEVQKDPVPIFPSIVVPAVRHSLVMEVAALSSQNGESFPYLQTSFSFLLQSAS